MSEAPHNDASHSELTGVGAAQCTDCHVVTGDMITGVHNNGYGLCHTDMVAAGGEALVTADHGNAELLFDVDTGQRHTAHTTNPVPLIYIGRPATLHDNGVLSDLSPTLLEMMGLPQPEEMTGRPLIEYTQE